MRDIKVLCLSSAALALTLAPMPSALGSVVTREVLKTYFETGDVPTQEQFAITSPTGDPDGANPPDLLFSRVSTSAPAFIWRDLGDGGFLSDGAGHALFLADGETLRPTSGQFATLIDSTVNIIEDRYLLGLRFWRPDGFHYGYLDISFDAPLPGWPDYTGFTIHGWAYETEPNTPIVARFIPAPGAGAAVLGAAGLLAARRRPRS